MKIISWNCNGKFREKYKHISRYDADIYVIQECENPKLFLNPGYKDFCENYLWTGENKNKGLGIFAKPKIKLTENNWKKYGLRNFISAKVNDEFDLLGVWACKPYIEEYFIYQNINIENFNTKTILIGDFNSNAIWDKEHGQRNHTAVVKMLEKIDIISAYHDFYGEEQGKESRCTFYLYRHKDKGYHIDYCFTNKNNIKEYKVLTDESFLSLSDHMPIYVERRKT